MADEILLKLIFGKKWIPGQNFSGETGIDKPFISLFGHYDTLYMESPDNWNEFRPGRNAQASIDRTINDEYTMRLVCPREVCKIVAGVGNGAYDYPKFYGISNNDRQRRPFPIVASMLIHLSDRYLEYVKNDEEYDFQRYSIDFAEKVKNNIDPIITDENIEYAVYFNLGYPDVVVLFYSAGIKNIERCVDVIRDISFSSTDVGDGKAVSSAYTIIGYVNDCDKFDNELVFHEPIKADIDLTFNTPCGFAEQRDKLKTDKISDNAYMMFGNYDWRCVTENGRKTLGELIAIHKARLSPYHGAGKDEPYRHVVTRILCTTDDGRETCCESAATKPVSQNSSEKNVWKCLDEEVYNAFTQFEKLCEEFYKSSHSHRRPISAVREVILLYFKIISTTHCGDVKRIVGRFIVSYLTSLSALVKYYLYDNEKNDCGPVFFNMEGTDSLSFAVAFENALTQFRIAVNPLLFDIWRSDSEYFEGQTTEHPTVGSAMKLVFAYNRALEKWDNAYSDNCESDSDTGFTYLVTSGGKDITENVDIFDCNQDIFKRYGVINGKVVGARCKTARKISRPIVVFIPESSLYNVEGTLHLLSHEFFHKRGDRLRGTGADIDRGTIEQTRATFFYDTLCDIAGLNCKYIIMRRMLTSYARFVFDNLFYKNTWREIYRCEYDEVDGFQGWIYHVHNYIYERGSDDLIWLKNCFACQPLDETKNSIAQKRVQIINKYDKSKADKLIGCFEKAVELLSRFREKLEKHFNTNDIQTELKSISRVMKDAKNKILVDWIKNEFKINGKNAFHSKVIYEVCYNTLKYMISTSKFRCETSEVIRRILTSCASEFCIGSELLGSTEWLGKANDGRYCEGVCDEIAECFSGGEPPVAFLYTMSGMDNWMLDFDNVKNFVRIWFTECYADCMALSAMGLYKICGSLSLSEDDMISAFMKYLFIFIFENRDLETLFCPGDNFANCRIDGEAPIIAFNGAFMRIGIVKDVFWKHLNSDIFRNNEDRIKRQIKEYYKDVMYGTEDGCDDYANRLYDLLLRVLSGYERLRVMGYTDSIIKYLSECVKVKENIDLFDKIKEMTKSETDSNSGLDIVSYIENNWLDCYSEN